MKYRSVIFGFLLTVIIFSNNNPEFTTQKTMETVSNGTKRSESSSAFPMSAPEGENLTLTDTVEFFPVGEHIYVANITMLKDWIYHINFETYIPLVNVLDVDIFGTAPSGFEYHFFNGTYILNNRVLGEEFDYGSAESGVHRITFLVTASHPTNIHLQVKQDQPIEGHYADRAEVLMDRNYAYIADIRPYYAGDDYVEYTLPMIEDMEYWVNFFRINPISTGHIAVNNYSNPMVSMDLTLGEGTFEYYDRVLTRDHDWIDENPGNIQGPFLMRFGAHTNGNATFRINISFHTITLNFAFFAYVADPVGDGPEDVPTDPWYFNDNNATVLKEGEEAVEETAEDTRHFIVKVVDWVSAIGDEHFNTLAAICLGAAIVLFVIQEYARIQRVKVKAPSAIMEKDTLLGI